MFIYIYIIAGAALGANDKYCPSWSPHGCVHWLYERNVKDLLV